MTWGAGGAHSAEESGEPRGLCRGAGRRRWAARGSNPFISLSGDSRRSPVRATPDLRLQLIKWRIEDTIRQCFIAFRFFISPYYSGVAVSLSSAQEKALRGGAAGGGLPRDLGSSASPRGLGPSASSLRPLGPPGLSLRHTRGLGPFA